MNHPPSKDLLGSNAFIREFEKHPLLDVPTVVRGLNADGAYYDISDVVTIFAGLSELPEWKLPTYVRIYTDLKRLPKFRELEIIRSLSRYDSFSDIPWDDFFGASEFMIFVNYAGLFHKTIHEKSIPLTAPIVAKFDERNISIEHHVIIGRYSQTPFGVHIDDPTDRVLHVNLAQPSKSMILWQRDEVAHLIQKQSSFSIAEPSLGAGIEYIMETNDAFVLPHSFYHVGRSMDGISAGIAIAFSKVSTDSAAREIQSELSIYLSQRVPPSDEKSALFAADDTDLKLHVHLEELDANLKLTLANLFERARTRRKSACGFADIGGIPDSSLLKSGYYQWHDFFRPQLLSSRSGEVATLFSRGAHLEVGGAELIDRTASLLATHLVQYDTKAESDRKINTVTGWLIATGSLVAGR